MPPAKKIAAKKKTDTSRWVSHNATDAAVKRFEETFAKEMGTDLTASRSDKIVPYEVIPTGSIALDRALRIGGWPVGRVCEVWGPEHAGKTTMMMLAVREAQRKFPNKMVGWADMEQTFDNQWATTLGVDLNRLWRPPVHTAEQCADTSRRFVESGLCSMVIIDSVGAMISQKEFEKEADEATVAIVAKIVTRAVKQVSTIGAANGTTTMVINQVRSNIGGYGASETESGGWALKHITSVKCWVKRGESLTIPFEGKDLPVGHEVAVRVTKNKCAPYGNSASFFIKNQPTQKYGEPGVDIVDEAATFAVSSGVVRQSGGWYYPDPAKPDFKFQGKEKLVDYLRAAPGLIAEIRDKTIEQVMAQVNPVEDDSAIDLSDVEV